MRTIFATFAFAASVAAMPAYAASTAADILAANKQASGGTAWDGKETVKLTYDFSGFGLTGKTESTFDMRDGRLLDTLAAGPITEVQGYDGKSAWAKDQSGTVTSQNGADRYLLVNESYRDANMWWRPDFGGAAVTVDPQKSEGGTAYDVLTVAPKNGGAFDAWFDAETHLLYRIEEKQGGVVNATTLTDYRKFEGVLLAGKQVTIPSDTKNPISQSLTGASFSKAEPESFYAMPKVEISDASIAGGAKETSFPFRLVNNHIYADVKVNGQGPFTFIFDTGGLNLVTPNLARKLGLKSEGDLDARGGGSGTMKASITTVKRLDLGAATIGDQNFMSLPLDSMSNIEGMDMPGMIGFETFRRFVTRIDYGNNTITLTDPKKFDPKNSGIAVPIAFSGNDVEVEGSYDGVKGKFVIDTGARNSLMLTAPFVEANKLHDGSVKSAEAVTGWGIGGPTKSFVQHGGLLKLGSVDVKGPLVLLSTDTGGANAVAELAGNVGGGILKRFVVTFDYEHDVMYLKPLAGRIDDLDTFDRSGMWINKDDAGFKVVDVTADTPAAQAGLAAGDIVTGIDGKPATSIALPDIRKRLRDDAPGTVVTLAVKGKGEVKITLRDLI